MANKLQTIRWSIELAASEFGINPRTVAKMVKSLGIQPGKDGKFSTAEMASAIFGDLQGEVLRRTREEALKLEIANLKELRRLAEVPKIIRFCNGIGVIVRQKLLSCSMSDDEKDELLGEIRAFFDAGTVTDQVCPP